VLTGTKLGAGGLIRGYGASARASLGCVERVEVVAVVRLQVEIEEEYGHVVHSVAGGVGVKIEERGGGGEGIVRVEVCVPVKDREKFVKGLKARCGGVTVEEVDGEGGGD